MKRSAKHMLIGAGLVAGGMAATAYLVTRKLMSVAIKRNGIRNFDQRRSAKQLMKASDRVDDFLAAMDAAKASMRAVNMRRMTLESFDGLKLVAHWYPADNAKRIIVAMHGWRSSWMTDFGMMVPFWHEQGCHVLLVEQRGQGRSDGEYMGFGMTERFDCRDWVRRVDEKNKERLPIYLVGVSMGAATVMMASALDLPDTVRGVIADCGYTSPHAIWKHVANRKFHLPYEPVGKWVDDICRKNIKFGSKEITATQALKRTSLPILFIHGSEDHFVPVTMTYENYRACASEKRLLIVPGADHAMSYFVDKAAYETAVKAFWNDFDHPARTGRSNTVRQGNGIF